MSISLFHNMLAGKSPCCMQYIKVLQAALGRELPCLHFSLQELKRKAQLEQDLLVQQKTLEKLKPIHEFQTKVLGRFRSLSCLKEDH